jgi:hypothetical protein
LADECEAVKEAMPLRRVGGITGFHQCHDESFMLKLHWVRGSPTMCMRLEEDGPMVGEFRMLL